MMLPFINHTKQFFLNKSPYVVYKATDSLGLTDKNFTNNPGNLVSSIEQVDPLVLKFRNHRSMFEKIPTKYFSTTVWVTFYDNNNASKIDLIVKTSPMYYLMYGTLTFVLIINTLSNNFSKEIWSFLASISIFAIVDYVSKRSILRRVEDVLKSI